MHFDYTEEQQLLADTLRRFLASDYSFDARAKIVASPEGWSPTVWAALAEMGLLGLPFAEEYGGFGGSAVDLMLVPRWPATASTTKSPTRSPTGCSAASTPTAATPQSGWDTDQFPNSVEDLAMPLYEILRGGGFTTGGFNFDAKLRRQSISRTDLFHAHIGGIDTLARALLVAADMVERGTLAGMVEERYAGWNGALGASILSGDASLESLAAMVEAGEIDPRPVSGRQERYENLVNQHIWGVE